MEENEKWLGKLREKLDNHIEPLPVDGWDRLKWELTPVSRSRPLYTWSVVAVVALLLLLPAGWWFLQLPVTNEGDSTPLPGLAVNPGPEPEVSPLQTEPLSPVAQTEEGMASFPTSSASTLQSGTRQLAQGERTLQVEPDLPSGPIVEEAPMIAEQVEEPERTSDVSSKEETKERRQMHRPSDRSKYHLPVKNALADNKKISFGVRVGNTGVVSEGMEQLPAEPLTDRISLATVSGNSVQVGNNQTIVVRDGIPYLVSTEENVTDAKHRQPVTVGFTVRKELGKGFSMESGLTYTFLSSDITLSQDQTFAQKLHYMGIPVRGNWDFFEKNNFTLYLSAGGMAEKCIYGKLGDDKKTEGPLQLSVMGAVGAQYSPTRRVAIYFEPGVSYYFDNGSDFVTIRKDNPVNLNLQAGIRLVY
ncbi:MAG: porin family protein [Bacteroides sp.]|nr:porin family protein [Bacteroides sp.]